jgi:hypothetical protein
LSARIHRTTLSTSADIPAVSLRTVACRCLRAPVILAAEHKGYLAAAVVSCLLYTVGIPVVLLYMLKTRREDPVW